MSAFLAVNLGVSLSVIVILQVCKFMWRDWLTKDDIRENNSLTLKASIYSLITLLLIFLYA